MMGFYLLFSESLIIQETILVVGIATKQQPFLRDSFMAARRFFHHQIAAWKRLVSQPQGIHQPLIGGVFKGSKEILKPHDNAAPNLWEEDDTSSRLDMR